jgi:hypothetical protein
MSDDHYLDPYRESELRHGTSFGVTLWANERTQQRRFEVFTELCYLHGKRLLDAGCSRGDLAQFLFENHIDFAGFVGIDGMANVIDFANNRRIPQCRFEHGDFVTNPDLLGEGDPQVILISGTLNTMTDAQIQVVLEGAWSHTSEVLLFNFLSDRCASKAPLQDDFSRRLNTLEMIKWATSKTPAVTYRQDYLAHGHDGTIMMSRV